MLGVPCPWEKDGWRLSVKIGDLVKYRWWAGEGLANEGAFDYIADVNQAEIGIVVSKNALKQEQTNAAVDYTRVYFAVGSLDRPPDAFERDGYLDVPTFKLEVISE